MALRGPITRYPEAGRRVSPGPGLPSFNPWAHAFAMQAALEDQRRRRVNWDANDFDRASGTTEYFSSTVDFWSEV